MIKTTFNAATGATAVGPMSNAEILSLQIKSDVVVRIAKVGRQDAYTQEADPLFFKWQAGEGTEAEWLAKRE
jgi:hypothetical protein